MLQNHTIELGILLLDNNSVQNDEWWMINIYWVLDYFELRGEKIIGNKASRSHNLLYAHSDSAFFCRGCTERIVFIASMEDFVFECFIILIFWHKNWLESEKLLFKVYGLFAALMKAAFIH